MANPDEVYPVDLQTAGAGQADTPPGGLVDALRSQGTPPSGLMEALRPPQLTAPSMAAYAATAGLNPTGINPVQRQQNIQQEMQMQQAQLIQRAQEHQQQLQMQKSATAAGVLKDMLFGANAIQDKGARTGLAKQNAGLLTQITGQQIPQSVVDQWAMGGPNQKSQKRLAELVSVADIAKDPQEKMQALQEAQKFFMQNGGTPQDWASTYKLMSNPSFLKAAGLPSMEQNQIAAAKTEEELNKAYLAQNPELASLKGQERAPALAAEFARTIAKKPLREVTDPTEMAAMASFVKAGLAREKLIEQNARLDEKRSESDIILAREEKLARFKAGLKEDTVKELTIPQKLQLGKHLDKASTRTMILENADQLLKDLPALKAAGILPSGPGNVAAMQAWVTRNSSEKNNTLWTNFQLNWAPLVIGQVDRGLKDEKASRSIASFGSAIGVGENGAPADALEKYLKFVKQQVMDAGNRDITNAQTMGLPQNVIDGMRGIYGKHSAGPLDAGPPREKLSREKYNQAKQRGYSDDEIRAKGYDIP